MRIDDSEDEKLLYSSGSSVYAKRHLPFNKLSIQRVFLFNGTVVLCEAYGGLSTWSQF